MGVKIKATGELKLNDSPDDDNGRVVQDGGGHTPATVIG